VARRAKLGRFQLPGLKWLLLPATAVVCALIAFFIWNAQRETPEKVEKLLAQAYTEQRTMDMRWPGANYAPIRVTRGEGVRRFSKPNELLKAEKILTERQDNSSQTVDWLTARGEMELLNGRDQSAIDDLAKALTIEPESARIELLLGIAYAYNAELSESAGDREKALSYFTKVLNQEPANSAALFNRALLYQRAHDGQRAIADWKTLLSTEHDSAWAAEARRRMNEITSQVR
jgi:tetratricopeptide (TPR) repeat protein